MKLEDFKTEMAARDAEYAIDWWATEKRLKEAMAMAMAMARDIQLMQEGRSERAVAHRLAVYLEDRFPRWHVDCEYNRQGTANSYGAREKKSVSPGRGLPGPPGNPSSVDIDPDIIVHQRGPDGPNLLVIEVKPVGVDLKKDLAKLRKCLTEPHLRYRFAVSVTYRMGTEAGFAPLNRVFPE